MKNKLTSLSLFAASLISAHGAVFQFSLDGIGGTSLLPGNENPPAGSGGTGGIGAGGISYDSSTGILNLDLEWGSGNGFTDLTGPVTAAHIHGATGPLPSGLTQNAGVLYDLAGTGTITLNTSATAGSLTGTVLINAAHHQDLIDSKTYINIHTAANPAGEMRGQLVATAVPEPHEWGMIFSLGAFFVIGLRRRWLAQRASVAALVLLALSNPLQAQVLWNFSTSDGADTLSGQFTTFGNFSQTQGTGTHNFGISAFNSFFVNGVNQTANFTDGAPTAADQEEMMFMTPINDTFTWSRDSQSVTAIANTFLIGTEAGPGERSLFQIALPGGGSAAKLIDGVDANPNVEFIITTTTFTPVPEPGEYALAAGLSLLGFAFWRSNRGSQAIA